MKISTIRILNIVLTFVLIAFGKFFYIIYIVFNQLLLEILNTQPLYKAKPYKWYNLVFWLYELVLLERLRNFKLNPTAEWWLNNIEHICFALVIGFLLYLFITIFWLKGNNQRFLKALLVAVVFNTIGLINEWHQNALAGRNIFILIADSVKDIKMNLIGTSIFCLIVLGRILWLQKKPKG